MVTPEEQSAHIRSVLTLVEEHYVFPEKVPAITARVNNALSKNEFDEVQSCAQFAGKLTALLQAGSGDKHFRATPAENPREEADPSGFIEHWFQMSDWVRTSDYGFNNVQVLGNNIGYINVHAFFSKDLAAPRADACMKLIENTHAVIIDLRENGGGKPDMVQYLCSYFFKERILLNSLIWPKEDITEDYWVLDEVNGEKRPDSTLYILTSNRTFSAAEEFAYNMQSRKRALIIGEVTGGGANPGKVFNVSGLLNVFISTGRAVNPVTKSNWEAIGVQPDIEINSELALQRAIELSSDVVKHVEAQTKVWFREGAENVLLCIERSNELLERGQLQGARSLMEAAVHHGECELNFSFRDFRWLSEEYRTRFSNPAMAELIMQVVDDRWAG